MEIDEGVSTEVASEVRRDPQPKPCREDHLACVADVKTEEGTADIQIITSPYANDSREVLLTKIEEKDKMILCLCETVNKLLVFRNAIQKEQEKVAKYLLKEEFEAVDAFDDVMFTEELFESLSPKTTPTQSTEVSPASSSSTNGSSTNVHSLQPSAEELAKPCRICLIDALNEQPYFTLDCGHTFHIECLARSFQSRWVRKKCVVCSSDFCRTNMKRVVEILKNNAREEKKKRKMLEDHVIKMGW